MTGSAASRTAEVGDLVRDTGRDCEAVLTDVRDNVPYLRRRLLRLSVRLWWHPYWDTARSAPAARTELRQLARTQ
ncbi:hypothetical protein [Streptomyces daghestanicus]|uniref:hypothetical protein n=1 Tax=Streptomyces daghestanicus TaxID=66885 RepID=UPI00167D7974|nr:hypothetical protein [Streptomyces daghestanicus]GGU67863.1 hypothetical protein GCM10010259_67520 [Streptomyces daghestanicus]